MTAGIRLCYDVITRFVSRKCGDATDSLFGSHEQPTHLYKWFFCLGILLAAVLYVMKVGAFQVGVYWDDAAYVTLARSISSEGVYGYVHIPGEVSSTRYPFGFPLLLAPLTKLFPADLRVLQLVSLVTTLANGCLLHKGSKRLGWGNEPVIRLFIPLLYLFAPLVSGHAVMVMTEAVFTFWTLLALLLLSQVLTSSEQRITQVLLLSAVVFAAAVTRTLGYVLLLIAVASLVITKRYRQSAVFILSFTVIFALLWIVLPLELQDFGISTEYLRQFHEAKEYEQVLQEDSLPTRMLSLLWLYISEGVYSVIVTIGGVGPASRALLGRWGLDFIPSFLALLTSGLIALGMILSHRDSPIPLAFTVAYCGALLLWPFYLARFLYPVLPFLLYYFLYSIVYLLKTAMRIFLNSRRYTQSRFVETIIFGICLILLLASMLRSLPTDTSLNHTLDLSDGTEWIDHRTSREAVIMAENPIVASIYANCSVVDYPKDLDALLNKVDKYQVEYLLIRPVLKWTTPRTLELSEAALTSVLPYLQSNPYVFALVYDNPAEKTYVYRVESP